jgi:tetratricopeptide (TPR) repeat protein
VPIDRAATLANAEKLLRQGKPDLAIAVYARVVEDDPRDWNTANLLGDLYLRAGQNDKAVEHFRRVADQLCTEGFLAKAGALYKKILKIYPEDEGALVRAGEIAGQQRLLADARTYFNAVRERRRSRGDARGAAEITIRLGALDRDDYATRVEGAAARVQTEEIDTAVREFKAIVAELVEKDRTEEAIAVLKRVDLLGLSDPELAARHAELTAEPEVTELPTVEESPAPEPQIVHAFDAVDVLVTDAAQVGDWQGAVDLVREFLKEKPGDVAALLRLIELGVDGGLDDVVRRAQVELGDAYRESGMLIEADAIAESFLDVEDIAAPPPVADPREVEDVSPVTPPVAPAQRPAAPAVEMDLSVVLEDLRKPKAVAGSSLPTDLDGVFAVFRDEAARQAALDAAEEEHRRGLALHEEGRVEESIVALRAAARAPRLRFATAALLGRIHASRGMMPEAIEWFERAAEAPPPSPAEGQQLLYDLACTLEAAGEQERALAVFMELQADAGSYRDVRSRIERLVQERARG